MMLTDDDILNGIVPADMEEKEHAAKKATLWGRRSVSIQAMLIASARRDHFGSNLVEWVEWCEEYCGIERGDRRSHLDAVGRMLLSLNTDKYRKYFNMIFDLDSEKLIALQRLMVRDVTGADNPGTLITFLEAFKGKLGDMSRDKLRQHVKLWLQKDDPESEVKAKKTQSVQMVFSEFEKYICQLSEYTLDTVPSLLKDSGTAMKAGYGGYILLGGLVNAIRAGKNLLPAEELRELKGKLLDLADQIDDLTEDEPVVYEEPEDMPEEEPADDVEPEDVPEDEEPADDVEPEDMPEEEEPAVDKEPEDMPEERRDLRKPDFSHHYLTKAFFTAQAVENERCDNPPLSHATITNQNDCGDKTGTMPFDIGAALGSDRPRW